MYNKKALNVNLGKFIKQNPYKGDIIIDPMGQWNHPGENTRIPGSEITMNNVPYPVWAQPNVGPGMMMQPGQDYNFPGADYVDEFPQLQDGGEYEELDLTEEEIKAYRDGGYIIEELPKGGTPFLDAFTKMNQKINSNRSNSDMQITGTAWNGDPVYNDVNDPNYIQPGWGLDQNGNIPGTNIPGGGFDRGFDAPISEWQRRHPNNDSGFDAWPTRPSTGFHDPNRPWLFQDGGNLPKAQDGFNQNAYDDSLSLYNRGEALYNATLPFTQGNKRSYTAHKFNIDNALESISPTGGGYKGFIGTTDDRYRFHPGIDPKSVTNIDILSPPRDFKWPKSWGKNIRSHDPDGNRGDPYFESVSSDGMYEIDRYKKPVMTKKMWEAAQIPTLPTRAAEQIPNNLSREIIPMPEEDLSGTIKPPASVSQWVKHPQLGTWYEQQRPVKPENLESRKVGFAAGPGSIKSWWKKQEGGGIDIELTNEEIQQYRDGGYIVEELPMAQTGHSVKQRRGVRNNYDNKAWTPSGLQFPTSVSSHLMKAEYDDNIDESTGKPVGWVGFPSLFQDDKPYANDQDNWVQTSEDNGWRPIYEEAKRRGEVYYFGEDKEAALAFGMGSWKDQLPKQKSDKKLLQKGGENNNYIELDLDEKEIQQYRDGGYVVEEYQDGGQSSIYTYKSRPKAKYAKSGDSWFINLDKDTGNKYIPIDDPSGSRTKELNRNAVESKVLNPITLDNSNYDPNFSRRVALGNLTDTRSKAKRTEDETQVKAYELIKAYETDEGTRNAMNARKVSKDGNLTLEAAKELVGGDSEFTRAVLDKYDKNRGVRPRSQPVLEKKFEFNSGANNKTSDAIGNLFVAPVVESFKSLSRNPGQVLKIPGAFDQYARSWGVYGDPLTGKEWADADFKEGLEGAHNFTNVLPIFGGVAGGVKNLLPRLIKKGVKKQTTALAPSVKLVHNPARSKSLNGLKGLKRFPTDIKLKKIENQGKLLGLSPKEIAQKQMKDVGITSLQREAYTPLVSDALYYGINPRGTGYGPIAKAMTMPFNLAKAGIKSLGHKPVTSPAGISARDDAWGMFLGKPQKANTFSLAETSTTPGIYPKGALDNLEKFAINKYTENPLRLAEESLHKLRNVNNQNIGIYPHQGESFFQKAKSIYPEDKYADVMGNYNLRKVGPNTLEYNDVWDLAVPGVPNFIANKVLGKKFLSTGQSQFENLNQTLMDEAAKRKFVGMHNIKDFLPTDSKNKKFFNAPASTKNIEKETESFFTNYDHTREINNALDQRRKLWKTPEGEKRLQNFIDANPELKSSGYTPNLMRENLDYVKTAESAEALKMKARFYDLQNPNSTANNPYRQALEERSPNNAWFDLKTDQVHVGSKFTPEQASKIIEHEVNHFIQQGFESSFDKELGTLDLLTDLKLSPRPGNIESKFEDISKAKQYFETGSRGKEKLAMASELRMDMLEKGIIKDLYSPITENMIMNHYSDYAAGVDNAGYPLRLYDILEPSEKSFNILNSVLNKMAVAAPVAVGIGAASQNSEDKPSTYQQGGEFIETELTPTQIRQYEKNGYIIEEV